MSFLDSSFLWLDIVLAASAAAAVTAVVGVQARLRRAVFLPAALSQLAGLGVVAAFLVAQLLGTHGWWSLPRLYALLFAALGSVAFGLLGGGRGHGREWVLAAVYVASSAALVLIGGLVTAELHDVNDILFGNAIAIERERMIETLVVSGVLTLFLVGLARLFTAAAFDAQVLAAHGLPVGLVEATLFVVMGLAVATATRVVGALPAFAFAVFPAGAALALARGPRVVAVLAALLGAASAFLGYWLSFVWSLPTGATMAAAAAAIWLVARVWRKLAGAARGG